MSLPTDWESVALTELLDFRNGINFVRTDAGRSVKILGVGDFGGRESLSDFDSLKNVQVQAELGPDDMLANNDLVFVRSNGNRALVGRCVLIQNLREPVTFSGFTIRGRLINSVVDPLYLSKVMRSDLFVEHLRFHGGGSSISNLSQGVLASFTVPIPPLAEQRKIAEILRTWDDAIEKIEVLIGHAQGLYGVLAERLVVPSRPSSRRLGETTRELTQRNLGKKFGSGLVMGVSNRVGIVPMRAQTMADDLSRYKVLPPRAFAYNPMRINVGSIAASTLDYDVVVSPDYVLFECLADELLSEYLDHVLGTRWWRHRVNAGGSGSVRTRTYYADLAAIAIHSPGVDEQRRIANLLDSCRAEIRNLEAQTTLLRTQKRGIMQKLLTGVIRVSPDKKDV